VRSRVSLRVLETDAAEQRPDATESRIELASPAWAALLCWSLLACGAVLEAWLTLFAISPAYLSALARESGPLEPVEAALYVWCVGPRCLLGQAGSPIAVPALLAAGVLALSQVLDQDNTAMAGYSRLLAYRLEEPLELVPALLMNAGKSVIVAPL